MNKTLQIPSTLDLQLYAKMHRIRCVELLLLEYFDKGLLRGTTHTSLGQEATAVAALSFLNENDCVVSNHRSHGHFLAYCDQLEGLLYEIKGSSHGVCRGLGGSQHLHYKNFFSNGVLGGTVPLATGLALAQKLKNDSAVVVCFLGDGALGEGVVYESFNMAALWEVPVLYVIENNRYAQSTPLATHFSGSFLERATAFGIKTNEIESNDITKLQQGFEKAFAYIRQSKKPFCQVVHNYRFGPHSKGDDHRDADEIKLWQNQDPLRLAAKYFDADQIQTLEETQSNQIRKCFEHVFESDEPTPETSLMMDESMVPHQSQTVDALATTKQPVLVRHLNDVLKQLMSQDERVYLLGEDVLDPYGGAFKVSKGLSTAFPDRVISTPISEAGFMGISNGLALSGLLPIIEIMFGDFTTLIVDQLLNYATKFDRMYSSSSACPVIVRSPMGGYRGYGPTHSQSLEKLFFGIPGLCVVACDLFHDQHVVWQKMIELSRPCFYVENKSLYGQSVKHIQDGQLDGFDMQSHGTFFPLTALQLAKSEQAANAIIFSYGGLVSIALDVAKKMFVEEEWIVKVAVVTQLSPLPIKDILATIGDCRTFLVLEEGTERNGWGSELLATLATQLNEKITCQRCAAENTIIPNSKSGEAAMLPSFEKCYGKLEGMLNAI